MRKNCWLYGFLILVLGLLSGCDEGENSWQRAARQDLAFMREQILANHPGPVNQEDPDFTKKLETAYDSAIRAVTGIKNRDDYWRALEQFASSFHDEHLRVYQPKKRGDKPDKRDTQEKFAFDEVAPQIAWIRLPTFEPDEEQQQQLTEMFKMLLHLRNYKAIVFDLHGNTGGNNAWGNLVLEALFSPTYVQQQLFELWQTVAIDYRVSSENLAHIRQVARVYAKKWGKESELARGYKEFGDIMQVSLEQGDTLVRVPKGSYKPVLKNIKDPVHALIVVIIDHKCAGASLDFIDTIKNLSHPVILFGETTGADTFYMDVRELRLPSSYGIFGFPIKVFHGRARGNNQPYKPDIPYNGDLDDTPRVAEAVYRLIMGKKG